MVFQHRFLRIATALGLVSMLVVLPGCPLSPDGDNGGGGDNRIPPRTSVTGAIDQFAFIWTNKRYVEYEQLLHDNFEYFPQTEDLAEFPWLTADSWGRTEELGMARNMFDENFVSQETGNSVDSIEMDITIESQTDSPDGVIVQVHAVARVLWAANTGATSDVRFEFLVVPDPDEPGLFQIREQRERRLI